MMEGRTYIACTKCNVRLRSNNLEKHIRKVHGHEAEQLEKRKQVPPDNQEEIVSEDKISFLNDKLKEVRAQIKVIDNILKTSPSIHDVMSEPACTLEELKILDDYYALIDSKRSQLLEIELRLNKNKKALAKSNKNKKRKRSRSVLKRARPCTVNIKINKKTSRKELEKEIERLKIQLSNPRTDFPNKVRNRIKVLQIELDHRLSGFNRPTRILQGGNTGLKK